MKLLKKLSRWIQKVSLHDDAVKQLASCVNRSEQQEYMLYNLCERDFNMLLRLEAQIKRNHIAYCPGDSESVNHILNLKRST